MEGSALTPFAWFFMILSMGSVTVLTGYCYYRILFASKDRGSDSGGPEETRSPARTGSTEGL